MDDNLSDNLGDRQIQELLQNEPGSQSKRDRATRPALLVVAFLTVIVFTTILSIGPWYSLSPFLDHWIRMILMETRFSAYVAVVFWLSFRPRTPSSIARIVPSGCVLSALALEWEANENTLSLWLTSYRLAIVWLVFELVRRGFRIALQSASEPPFATRGLNLARILCVTALFALLLLADIQMRKSAIGRGQGAFDFPPALAIASACSRSLLWIGLALLFAQGDRRYKIAGVASLFSWLVTRASIVVYLNFFQKSGFSSQRISELEQLMIHISMQAIQFGFVLSTCGLLLWTGYRIRIGSKPSNPEISAEGDFDSIQ